MISVVIPTLNEEKRLPLLLKSIISQKIKNIEVIVSDANSKDNTLKIARSFNGKIDVRTVVSKKNNSPSTQRNNGAKHAKYPIIVFVDADTVLPQNFLKKSIFRMNSKKLDVMGVYVWPKGSNIFDFIAYFSVNLFMWLTQFGNNPRAAGICFFSKKEVHRKIKGFDNSIKICEDYDYTERAVRSGYKFRMSNTYVFTSPRRFKKVGRLRMAFRYLAIEFYRRRKGPIREEIFEYNFGDYK